MKVRIGFVSNSSSSSFLIYGFETSAEEMAPVWDELEEELQLQRMRRFYLYNQKTDDELRELLADENFFVNLANNDKYEAMEMLGVDYNIDECDTLVVGTGACDPTELSIDQMVEGWVTVDSRRQVDEMASLFGKHARTYGGTNYG